jgi:hypothetical protein
VPDNADAKDFLDYYLGRDGDPEYAVLLEGAWGSGKSYFVESYFSDRLKVAKAENDEAKDPLVHVTLFGIRELADITTQMFEKAHPKLGGKWAKGATFVASKAFGLIGASIDTKESAGLLQDWALNLEGRVIVFDDLERCPLPLVEVMGYINQFVEHRKLRVIVVASEDDIPEAQREEYFRRKEKAIGKTIRVGSDPADVIAKFAETLKSAHLTKLVEEHGPQILSTVSANGKPNFRSVRAILMDFQRLLDVVASLRTTSDDVRLAVLLYMLATGIEYRAGGLDRASLAELQSVMQIRYAIPNVSSSTSEREKLSRRLRESYVHVSWNDPIIHPRHMAELFASGSVDVEAIEKHLLAHPAIVGPEKLPAWRRLWGWFDLGHAEYQSARDELANELQGRKLTHPGEILHAAGITIRLRRFGDDLLGAQAPLAYFRNYLRDVEAQGTLQPAIGLFGPMGKSFGGLVYNDHDNPTFAKVEEMIEKANLRAQDRQMSQEAGILVSRLRSAPRDSAPLIEWDRDAGHFGALPILHHVQISDFADLLLVDGKLNDHLLSALGERYRRNAELDREYAWLRSLRSELNRRIAKVPAPHRKLCELRSKYGFDQIDDAVALAKAAAPRLAKRRAHAKKVQTSQHQPDAA